MGFQEFTTGLVGSYESLGFNIGGHFHQHASCSRNSQDITFTPSKYQNACTLLAVLLTGNNISLWHSLLWTRPI